LCTSSSTSRSLTFALAVQVSVTGMHCSSCSTAVEKALRSVTETHIS